MSLKLQEAPRRWLSIYDKLAIIEASKLQDKESVLVSFLAFLDLPDQNNGRFFRENGLYGTK